MSEATQLRARISRVLSAFGGERPLANDAALEQLLLWTTRVLEWNQRIDLTAARSHDELVDLLVADAAAIAMVGAGRLSGAWVDVGSGAGGPGLGLALLVPESSLTLVEPKAKRVAFLRSVLGELAVSRVRVQRARSDELPSGTFDGALSRATFSPGEWLKEGARLARTHVWVLLAQAEAPPATEFRPVLDHRYVWPLTGAERRLVLYVRADDVAG
ncbi:MAG TPA: RsmG family class I SAM-dependent methyltransferase [Polyangiaceae bacterium]|nr:RsmG family class I SAM-dependent methyltransferase [Polyangiaceae bacterium]